LPERALHKERSDIVLHPKTPQVQAGAMVDEVHKGSVKDFNG